MFLGNTLSAATSGLDSIERQIALLSQNVSNASTPNYVRESLPLSSLSTAGGPAGVKTGLATRSMDDHLQANLFSAVATEAGTTTTQAALAGIDQISGTPGSGQDVSSLFGALRDSLSTLAGDPASASQQLDVISKANAFAGGLHTVGGALLQAKQSAQDTLQADATTANNTLQSIGRLSDQIIAAKASGQSTADLENERDGQLKTLTQLTGAKYVSRANGDMQVIAGNTVLPTHAATGPFSLATANLSPDTLPASIPALQLNGTAVTSLGGQMGANLKLRDTTIPAMQSTLDGFAQSVASAFQGQGLPLFTDGAGNVPTAATAGFASAIQVSTAVQATPTMIRDGTGTPTTAGDPTLINNVLSNVFSSSASGLPEQASSLIAGYAQMASAAQNQLDTDTSVRSGLETRLSSVTGVSVDSELAQMVQLQTAYAANAKVVSAVQNMWDQLLQVLP